MRTCNKCGCYIPDNWTQCPACNAKHEEKKIIYTKPSQAREDKLMIYRVDVLYDYERTKASEYFGRYENAIKYATRKAKENDIFAVQIISGGRIITTMAD